MGGFKLNPPPPVWRLHCPGPLWHEDDPGDSCFLLMPQRGHVTVACRGSLWAAWTCPGVGCAWSGLARLALEGLPVLPEPGRRK